MVMLPVEEIVSFGSRKTMFPAVVFSVNEEEAETVLSEYRGVISVPPSRSRIVIEGAVKEPPPVRVEAVIARGSELVRVREVPALPEISLIESFRLLLTVPAA